MSQRVIKDITVRRPHEEIAAFITDPHRVLEAIPGFARFEYVGDTSVAGGEEWDVFLGVGTLHVGGRVLVSHPSVNRLQWRSLRGTQHAFHMTVEPLGEHSRLTMSLEYHFPGLVGSRVAEIVARGIVARHLEAGLQEIRHLLEYGDAVTT